jgi:predicted  nucleic acid-binding Zn-ribbon protein
LSSKLFETTQSIEEKRFESPKTESFVDLIEMGVVKLPELQDQYQKLQDKVQGLRYNLQDMQYRKQALERYLQAIQQRIIEQTDAQNTLQQTFDTSAEKVSKLYKENTG